MVRIIFTDYFTGKKVKQLTVKNCGSIQYGPEVVKGVERFVVRDYFSYKIIRTCALPSCSFQYRAVKID